MNYSALSHPVINRAINCVQTNPIVGPAAVNLFAMVIPRTIIDFTRSEQAGKETLRRESSAFAISTFLYPAYHFTFGQMKYLKSRPVTRSMIGMGLVAASAFSLQFVNKYLTKKETGSDKFVGLPDYDKLAQKDESDDKKGSDLLLWAEKAASIAGVIWLAGSAITGKINPKKILPELRPKAFIEHIKHLKNEPKQFLNRNQLRVYACAGLIGRMLASRDGDELRETNTRDYPSFMNWLVLDNIIAKLTGLVIAGKDMPKLFKPKAGKGLGDFPQKGLGIMENLGRTINNISLKNADELQGNDILMGKRNAAIGSGLLYAGVMLGYFLPTINKKITNASARARHKKFADIDHTVNTLKENSTLVGAVNRLA